MRNSALLLAASILAASVAGCSTSDSSDSSDAGGSTASGRTSCDPLAAGTTTLQDVLAAGTDANGTMYIVDAPSSGEQRIFVSSGAGLVRVPNVGSGQNGTSQYLFTFTSPGSTTSGDEELFVDTGSGTTTMAISAPTDSKDFTPPSDATTLTVVDPSSVEGKSAQDLPGTVVYVADVSDGTTLVITAPGEPSGYSGFRLFLGTPPTLTQETVSNYNESVDGAVFVDFAGAGGSTAHLSIPCQSSTFCSDASTTGSITEASGATTTLTIRQPTPTTLANLAFLCQ